MNLRQIVENFRSYRRAALDDWMLAEVLTALFNDVVSLEFRNDTAELLERSRFGLYTLFDFPHDSSRACELHVLTVDDKLVGAVVRRGNRGEFEGITLDTANKAAVALELAAAAVRLDTANLSPVNLDGNLDLNIYPMKFLDSGETMFVLQNPRNVYRLEENRQRHPAYVAYEGRALLVENIGDFLVKGWVDGKEPADNLISVTVDGTSHTADATQLLFELVPGQGNLEEALKAYNQEQRWMVRRTSLPGNTLGVNNVEIGITSTGRWDVCVAWLKFPSASAMAAFIEAYPVGTVVAGIFEDSLATKFGAELHAVRKVLRLALSQPL